MTMYHADGIPAAVATELERLRAENARLRAENQHMRFHLMWIHNPAGNDLCTPKEIASMGLSGNSPAVHVTTDMQES